jgi:hypothetical protein
MTGEPSETGRQQFFELETSGGSPVDPDPYFLRLCDGKKWFDWLNTEMRESYLTEYWWGWYQLYEDWKDELWVFEKLTKWGFDWMPDWLQQLVSQAAKDRHEYETQKYLAERAEWLKIKYDDDKENAAEEC